ncbi:aminotransferase class V-fold PLP-dependent enzyme [Lignipirellula cremea]|uniref:cysteine desulfurase n=1 Tax=Lignipirellula cremea TaxID=2528010 RepID=A0A518DVZ0_9BACT|nr:aminotransferase class V-fold PLP-dependent enzyme [Lignipirellula cremea]QDU95994.1 putative cysteine desulfurase [Lignipirellula cremea]
MPDRIYLDNAATSWPKPEAVYHAADHFLRELGAPAGRGAYREAGESERLLRDTRSRLAKLLGAAGPERIIWTLNGTDALNLALHGLLAGGGHVVTSVAEHNSVLRPLHALAETAGVEFDCAPVDAEGRVDPDDIRAAIRPDTKLVVLTQASNVTGAVQPCAEVGRIAREQGVLFVVDAAQSLGRMPVDVGQLSADLVAAPGHKGLFGPLGTGFLYVGPGVESQLASVRQGGTGTHSDEDRQPTELPEKYESGNLNMAGIAGLHAGLVYLQERGIDAIEQHERALIERLLDGLTAIEGVTLYGPPADGPRVAVVSFNLAGYDSREVAGMLDSAYSLQCRAGIHCAPRMHGALGTLSTGGAVRFSPGLFNTIEQIDTAVAAVAELADSSF